jgi:hypothetical protein
VFVVALGELVGQADWCQTALNRVGPFAEGRRAVRGEHELRAVLEVEAVLTLLFRGNLAAPGEVVQRARVVELFCGQVLGDISPLLDKPGGCEPVLREFLELQARRVVRAEKVRTTFSQVDLPLAPSPKRKRIYSCL